MPLDSVSLVHLLTDRARERGVAAAAVVVVLDGYEDSHEVEFSREDGTMIAWFAVRHDEVEPMVGAAAAPPARHRTEAPPPPPSDHDRIVRT